MVSKILIVRIDYVWVDTGCGLLSVIGVVSSECSSELVVRRRIIVKQCFVYHGREVGTFNKMNQVGIL